MNLIVLHIPKTAGTSLRAIFHHIYGRDAVVTVGTDIPATRRKLRRQDLPEETKVLCGHITYRQIKELHNQTNAKVISFVRQPLDRYLSHYLHHKRETVRSQSKINLLRSCLPLWVHVLLGRYHNVMSRYLSDIPLESLDFVGLAEHFDLSIQLLTKIMNWEPIPLSVATEKKNVNVEHDCSSFEMSHALRLLLVTLNSRDQRLYDSAEALFNQRALADSLSNTTAQAIIEGA